MQTLAVIAALLVFAGAVTNIIGRYNRHTFAYRYSLIIMIGTVFAGLVLIYFPFARYKYQMTYPDAGVLIFAASLMQSIQSAFRTFVLDGEWSELLSAEFEIPILTTIVGLILNVLAPILTFSAILSLFQELRARYRVFKMIHSKNPMFIMSELNKDSLFLAEDIVRRKKKSNIVFTDVYPDNDEATYELKEKASKINAVFLRSDITELKLGSRRGKTEFFLIGHNEAENVMQAERLFKLSNGRENTSIYVQAVHKGNSIILDSFGAALNIKSTDSSGEGLTYEQLKNRIRKGGILKFRRFDPEKQVVWKEVPKMGFLKRAFSGPLDPEGDKTVSVLFFADTHLSYTAIRTLLWYCQSDRFRLKLNIVYDVSNNVYAAYDYLDSWPENVRKMLENECPEIIRTNKRYTADDAYYDIEFYTNDEFNKLYTGYLNGTAGTAGEQEKWARIAETDAVLIDRVQDVLTVETAIATRTAFERLGTKPEIYAVCADDENILAEFSDDYRLTTYKGENKDYDITFIGKRSDVYTYDNFINSEEEELGYYQHIKWVDVGNYRDSLKNQLINYEQREYYREASISKAIFLRNAISDPDRELSEEGVRDRLMKQYGKLPPDMDEDSLFERRLVFRPEYECENHPLDPASRWNCNCDKCRRRRILEHNRWNAYMRAEGYITSPEENVKDNIPIARIHGNIVPFSILEEKLPEQTKKDS